ncbi:MAG TPA: DUF1570 domain-containing protein [Gemmatales bacterium]|nr:DUF1570 domain-containing protein [Gemmatales bacterium]
MHISARYSLACALGCRGVGVLLSLVLFCLLIASSIAQESPTPRLEFDQLTLHNGSRVEGVVVEEATQYIRFRFLASKPGVRTLVFEVIYDRTEIAGISKAKEPGRTLAREHFNKIETSKKREATKVQQLPLLPAPWIEGGGNALLYQGLYFELLSNAQESLVRLVAVRLDEIFGAYVNTLGQRHQPKKPVRIILFHTLAEYRAWQEKKGISILNPAVYDAKADEILVGSDLENQVRQLEELKLKHQQQLKELTDQKKKLEKHYSGQPPALLTKQIQQLTYQLQTLHTENEAAFARIEAAFYSILYHEAFHAYLDQWVFPSTTYYVPRWLNEGLAQIYESAFVEVDQLKIGRIDEKRLLEIQDEVRRGRFMTIREILQAPPQQFFVRHTLESFDADRHYNASWALTHFLMFDLKLLGSPALVEFVSAPASGDEVKRFEKLVGMPIEQCEQQWKAYLLRLRTDGSLRPTGS